MRRYVIGYTVIVWDGSKALAERSARDMLDALEQMAEMVKEFEIDDLNVCLELRPKWACSQGL
jgi:hypothetical protein